MLAFIRAGIVAAPVACVCFPVLAADKSFQRDDPLTRTVSGATPP